MGGMVEGSLLIPRADGGFSFRERSNNGSAMHTGSISCILRGSVLLASFCINFWDLCEPDGGHEPEDDFPSLFSCKIYLRGLLSAMIANGNSYFPPICSVISYENEPEIVRAVIPLGWAVLFRTLTLCGHNGGLN